MTDEEVIQAAKAANAYDFIMALPNVRYFGLLVKLFIGFGIVFLIIAYRLGVLVLFRETSSRCWGERGESFKIAEIYAVCVICKGYKATKVCTAFLYLKRKEQDWLHHSVGVHNTKKN